MQDTSPPARALPRRLSLQDLVVYGLLFIGPLASASVFGVLDAQANGAVSLVYALATLVMACTAWSYGQMSSHVPHAGSVFAYAREGLGSSAGFLAGWMAMLDYLLIPALAYLFSGVALHALLPALPAWVYTLLAFLAANLLNFAGAREALDVLVYEHAVPYRFAHHVLGGLVRAATGGADQASMAKLLRTKLADYPAIDCDELVQTVLAATTANIMLNRKAFRDVHRRLDRVVSAKEKKPVSDPVGSAIDQLMEEGRKAIGKPVRAVKKSGK